MPSLENHMLVMAMSDEDGSEYDTVRPVEQHMANGFTRRAYVHELVTQWRVPDDIFVPYVLVSGHGGSKNGEWTINVDGELNEISVQGLLDQLDGKSHVIFLFTCNPGNCDIQTEQSLVVHFNEEISRDRLYNGRNELRVYVPGFGYITDARQAQRILRKIQE